MSRNKITILTLIPILSLYLMFFIFGSYVYLNASAIREINRLEIWVFMLLALLGVAIYGTVKIFQKYKKH